MYPPKTVIEVARRAMGASQAELALWAHTQQSSISEYESRRKSPTLEVVERLLAVLDFELAIKPVVLFETHEDPEIGQYVVPERLWSVSMPDCFGKIQVLGVLLKQRRPRVWDLSVEAERIDYYEWVIGRGVTQLMLESVDGVLLMQVWDRLNLPTVIREAWQPVIDAATASQDMAPRDPGGFSAWLAEEIGVEWRPIRKRKPRPPQKPIGRVSRSSPISVFRRGSCSAG
ncbi:MAG: helix-turn-helix domain-containing protein [Nocardioidaceae bacterium]|nr:helix-turn-helix domain-containing protein [Nocardioidaceae bacterium]